MESFLRPKQAVGCWGHLSTSLGGALIVIFQNAGADSFDPALFPDSPPLRIRKGRGKENSGDLAPWRLWELIGTSPRLRFATLSSVHSPLSPDVRGVNELWVGHPASLEIGFAICKAGIIIFSHQRSEIKKIRKDSAHQNVLGMAVIQSNSPFERGVIRRKSSCYFCRGGN